MRVLERMHESLWLLRVLFPAASVPSAQLAPLRVDASDGAASSLQGSFAPAGVRSPRELSVVMAHLRKANELDSELYAYAVGLFNERLRGAECATAEEEAAAEVTVEATPASGLRRNGAKAGKKSGKAGGTARARDAARQRAGDHSMT